MLDVGRPDWEQLKSEHRYRLLQARHGIDFCSNDYLGFADSLELKQIFTEKLTKAPLGSSSARLIRGHSKGLEAFEEKLARRCQNERALVMPSGYQANLALWSTLPSREAVVFSDHRVHASIIDGLRLSRCEKVIFPHNDLNFLETVLKKSKYQNRPRWIAIESIYSMTGTAAPLVDIVDLAEAHGAQVIVDEAHATGLFGPRGAGRVSELGLSSRIHGTLHAGGKAMGAAGAWWALSEPMAMKLINFSRPFIYSTGVSFPHWLLLQATWEFWDAQPEGFAQSILSRVRDLKKELQGILPQTCFFESFENSPILPIVLGTNARALKFSKHLQNLGLDVRAIRPPTVPEGEALLRITLPATRSPDEIQSLKSHLLSCFQEES